MNRSKKPPSPDTSLIRRSRADEERKTGTLPATPEQLQTQLDRLAALVQMQTAEVETLRSRLRQLQRELASTTVRVDDIYSSRIWRTLTQFGAALLSAQTSGHGTRKRVHSLVNDARGAWIRMLMPGTDRIQMCCDLPNPSVVTTLRHKAEIRGWACAQTGVRSVEIFVGGTQVEPVEIGMLREDVSEHFPEFPQSDKSGFHVDVDTNLLPAGHHKVRVVVTSRSGIKSEIECAVVVDHRTEYEIWRSRNSVENRRAEILHHISILHRSPKITVVTPVFRTPPEILERCMESVYQQMYTNWEHILVDDGSQDAAVQNVLAKWAGKDSRIRTIVNAKNRGIAAATNDALERATGEFIGFLDHDDELAPHALYAVVRELNRNPELDILYSDEDKIAPSGKHFDAFFKPGWSPDLLLSVNYMCHFLVCRRTAVAAVGGMRLGFDGSQDYDLILRLVEQTNRISRLPEVLYHWRVSDRSTAFDQSAKPEASIAGLRALQEHLDRTTPGASAAELFPGHYRVSYPLGIPPRVAIIIPSGGNPMLENALESVFSRTTYPNIEVLVVDNSNGEQVRNIVRKFETTARSIRIVDCRGLSFNFSLLCNRAANATDAPYLLFLNDDTSAITPDWLDTMMEHARRPEVGAVGSLLLFPDDRIQHAGVLMGVYGLAGHSFRMLDSSQSHYFHLPVLTRNCVAVTGACQLMRSEVFYEVSGFDEQNLPTAFQDVDICLKMYELGYRIVYTPHAQLYHFESASKKRVAFQSEIDYMRTRWSDFIDNDPFYNPNLTRWGEGYTLEI